MSLILKSMKGRLGLRLTGYFALLTLGALVLFAATYATVSAYLHHQDREMSRAALAMYAEEYRRGDIAAVSGKIVAQESLPDARPLFVRVTGGSGNDLLVHFPTQWDEAFDLAPLSSATPDAPAWMALPEAGDEKDGEVLEVAVASLSDGARLFVGQNGERRQDHL